MGYKGLFARQSADRIEFAEDLKSSDGTSIITGTTTLRLYELQVMELLDHMILMIILLKLPHLQPQRLL